MKKSSINLRENEAYKFLYTYSKVSCYTAGNLIAGEEIIAYQQVSFIWMVISLTK